MRTFCTSKDGINFQNFRLDVSNDNLNLEFFNSSKKVVQFQTYIYSNEITVYVQPDFVVSDLFTYFQYIYQKTPFCFFVCINQNQREAKTKYFYSGVNMFEESVVLPYLKNVFTSYKEALPKNKYFRLTVTFLFKERVDVSLSKLDNISYTEVDRRGQFEFLEVQSKLLFEIATIYNIPTIPRLPLKFDFKDEVIYENKLSLKKVIFY
jgi:hypothetical protein